MCQSTPPDALATQLADTHQRVTNREGDCIPIYEGMENWGNWDGTPSVEWTRIPPPANRRSIQPTVTSIGKCEHSTKEDGIPKPIERGRRRSVTRLQLTVPKTSQDPMTSSQLTQASSISTNIELRPTLRRAATISPVRRRPEIKDRDAVPNGPLANSSGFASAGSITGVQEDTGPVISRPLAPFRASERGQKRGANGLPPAVDVHAYPLVFDLKRGLERLSRSSVNNDDSNAQDAGGYPGLENRNSKLQILPPNKFLLGRVASNEDICIETETPFTFTIAATNNEICITKVASVSDLKQIEVAEDSEKRDNKSGRCVPVSLRLTFGSEADLWEKSNEQPSNSQGTCYRSLYQVNLPQASNMVRRPTAQGNRFSKSNNSLRYSLPCISSRENQTRPTELIP
ncbi:hypothetical protein X801_09332, partial [Opisthorchis viverrini]